MGFGYNKGRCMHLRIRREERRIERAAVRLSPRRNVTQGAYSGFPFELVQETMINTKWGTVAECKPQRMGFKAAARLT